MKRHKKLLLLLLLFLTGLQAAIAQDFKIEKFHENTMDMSAATSGVKDLNGNMAGLIRFVVRDDKFEFDANLGVLKKVMKTGEVWLYVPQHTKRVTISHPLLGVLRGYELPEAVKTKTTYDAEIVITNEEYLKALLLQSVGHETKEEQQHDSIPLKKEAQPKQPVLSVDTVHKEIQPPIDSVQIIRDKADKTKNAARDGVYELSSSPTDRQGFPVHLAIAPGYSLLGLAGPSADIELFFGNFSIGAGAILGNSKMKEVGIFSSNSLVDVYDYSVNKYSAGIGWLFNSKSIIQVTLQAGGSLIMLKGKPLAEWSNSHDSFKDAHASSVYLSLRIALKLGKHFQLYATPQYYMKDGSSKVFDVIEEADDKIKGWADGLGLKAGLIIKI